MHRSIASSPSCQEQGAASALAAPTRVLALAGSWVHCHHTTLTSLIGVTFRPLRAMMVRGALSNQPVPRWRASPLQTCPVHMGRTRPTPYTLRTALCKCTNIPHILRTCCCAVATTLTFAHVYAPRTATQGSCALTLSALVRCDHPRASLGTPCFVREKAVPSAQPRLRTTVLRGRCRRC